MENQLQTKAKNAKKSVKRMFATIKDAAALVMAIIYIVYVSLMLTFDLGTTWLNFAMLGITVVYIIFFLVKIFYINRVAPGNRLSRKVKRINKYTRYGMRFVNATFVLMAILSTGLVLGANDIIAVAGAIVLVMTFVLALVWDIGVFFIKKKIRDMIAFWNSLEPDKKKDKVDLMIEKLLESLDNVNIDGFADYIEIGFRAKHTLRDKITHARDAKQSTARLNAVRPTKRLMVGEEE